MAVLSVVGSTIADNYDDVDDHPGSLDLVTKVKRGRKPARHRDRSASGRTRT
jgi:hypothetical protein